MPTCALKARRYPTTRRNWRCSQPPASWNCQFIWHAHAAAGRRAGLSDALVDSLRDKSDLPDLSPEEAAVINYGREFFRTRRVTQSTFDAAYSAFGERGIVELTNLMGYYSVLAFNLNAFEQLPPASDEPFLPV